MKIDKIGPQNDQSIDDRNSMYLAFLISSQYKWMIDDLKYFNTKSTKNREVDTKKKLNKI